MRLDKQKLFIYSYARTGGTSISRYLNDILVNTNFYNEPFNFSEEYSVRKNDFENLKSEKKNINKLLLDLIDHNDLGFRHNLRNFSHSPKWFELDKYLIEKFKDHYVLILERENVLKSAISLQLARKYDRWNIYDEDKKPDGEIELKTENIKHHLEINKEKWKKRKEFIKSKAEDFEVLKYEDFYLNKDLMEKVRYLNNILEDLDGDYKTVFGTFDKKKKLNKNLYDNKIKNLDEIKRLE